MLSKYENLEVFPKEILLMIGLYLEPKDLLNFCICNKRIYEEIWKNNKYWIHKLKADFDTTYPSKPVIYTTKSYYKILYKYFNTITKNLDQISPPCTYECLNSDITT